METDADHWRIIRECHEGTGNSIEAKAMSGYFGRDKSYVACQCVKCGGKFEKGGEKLKSISVPRMPWRQLGIDCITNLPQTDEGYDTIVTAINYASKWPESKGLKGKYADGVAEFMYELVCHCGAAKIHISDQRREFVNQVCVNYCSYAIYMCNFSLVYNQDECI